MNVCVIMVGEDDVVEEIVDIFVGNNVGELDELFVGVFVVCIFVGFVGDVVIGFVDDFVEGLFVRDIVDGVIVGVIDGVIVGADVGNKSINDKLNPISSGPSPTIIVFSVPNIPADSSPEHFT